MAEVQRVNRRNFPDHVPIMAYSSKDKGHEVELSNNKYLIHGDNLAVVLVDKIRRANKLSPTEAIFVLFKDKDGGYQMASGDKMLKEIKAEMADENGIVHAVVSKETVYG